jgi:uridine kinase
MDSTSKKKEELSIEEFGKQLVQKIQTQNIDALSIDGQRAAGKTIFAKRISTLLEDQEIPNRVVSVDDFLIPRNERTGEKNPNDWYDHAKFKETFPRFIKKESFDFDPYNHSTGKIGAPERIKGIANQVLIFEGLFAAKFAEILGFEPPVRILLHIEEEKALERIYARDDFFSPEKNRELMDTIFFPAFREYMAFLQKYNFTHKFNTSDFSRIIPIEHAS